MNDQLQLLLDLQRFDLQCDEIEAEKTTILDNLEDVKDVLKRLQLDLEEQGVGLEEAAQLHEEKAVEHAEVEERYKNSKNRLPKVANTKEYSAIEMEIENAKRQTAQLEEEMIQLLEAIEATRETIAQKEAKIDSLNEQVGLEGSKANKQIELLEGKLAKLAEQRNAVADKVGKDTLRRYRFIRSRRDGTAIVPAIRGCCQGCFMQLPPQFVIELQRGNSMSSCPSCQRILFIDDREDDDTAES